MLNVLPILALKDNYIWAIVDSVNRFCTIIDPGEAAPVIMFLKTHQLTLCAVLITHHHHDHSAGIAELKKHFSIPIYGPAHETIAGVDYKLLDNTDVLINEMELTLKVYDIPGHTKGHIAYYGHQWLFSGDTLFSAGCGRLFEGTPKQMYQSLAKIAGLPDDTFIYCGHEYTMANLRFATIVEPNNKDIHLRIEQVAKLRKQNLPTLPTTLRQEKLTNPFLRCHVDSVITSIQKHVASSLVNPIEIFQALRSWKDTF